MPAAGPGHHHVRTYIQTTRGRGAADVVALEGLWAIQRALDAAIPIEVVFVCDALRRGEDAEHAVEEVRRRGGAVLDVSARLLQRMVARHGPDGLAALATLSIRTLADVHLGPDARVVVVDGCDLPGNLGTIVRCADGAGAAGVVQTGRGIRVNHPLVVKASMGTVFTTPVVHVEPEAARQWLSANGVRVVAAHPSATMTYRAVDYGGRTAVVVGSERHGLSPFWREAADVLVSIPMLGVADSLNVGHAAALLLYEALPSTRATQPGSSSRSSSAHSSSRWPAGG